MLMDRGRSRFRVFRDGGRGHERWEGREASGAVAGPVTAVVVVVVRRRRRRGRWRTAAVTVVRTEVRAAVAVVEVSSRAAMTVAGAHVCEESVAVEGELREVATVDALDVGVDV